MVFTSPFFYLSSKKRFPTKPFVPVLKPNNCYVVCSVSRKITTPLLKYWYNNAFMPKVRRGNKNAFFMYYVTTILSNTASFDVEDVQINPMYILANSTSINKPLDLMCFCLLKVFVKFFQDNMLVKDLNISFMTRNNVIKFQSLAHKSVCISLVHPYIQVSIY